MFALIIGLTVGTYSSAFLATPLWAIWKTAGEKGSTGRLAVAKGDKFAVLAKPFLQLREGFLSNGAFPVRLFFRFSVLVTDPAAGGDVRSVPKSYP